jgi:hypothetical protein
MRIAARDEAVARALRILAEPTSWHNLYRIFEVIRDNCRGEKWIRSHGWATKTAMDRFRHTANSPTAIGREARHGSERSTPPPNPVSIREARLLVETIVGGWLRWKVGNSSGKGLQL